MQQNDDILPQESAGASTPVAQGDTPTIQPVVNARPRNGRSLSIAAPGQTASVGLLQVGQQGLVTTAPGIVMSPHTVARPGVSGTQAVVMSSQAVTRLLSPPISLPLQLPTALNVLQRQLSAPGIVSLSSVSAQDLHQVLQQVTQQSITLLTADSTTTIASDSQRPRVARPLSFPLSIATSQLPSVTSSVSATGGTIHHHGQNPLRGAVSTSTVQSNLHQSLLSVSLTQQQQQALAQRRAVAVTVATTATTPLSSSVMSTQSTRPVSDLRTGQSTSLRSVSSQPPRKKIKIEEKPAPSQEIANFRKLIIEAKHKEMLDIKANYFENLTEMFFLQNGGNLMDYHVWKKRPTPQLVSFLKSGNLDSDDEEDVLQVKEINSEVKVLTNPGSNVPLATPVAISTTLPPLVSALNQQVIAPTAQAANAGTVASTSTTPAISLSSIPSLSSTSNVPQLQLQLSRAQDSKSPASKSQLSPSKHKSPPLSPGQRLSTRQQSLSAVYDQISGGSQEVIVERAKQEAQVMQRVAELRKEGLWSSRRLPRVQEPPRQKAHWDYLLEEMTWLAADFVQERKWKKAAARKLARMVSNYFKEQEQKELRAEKEEAIKLRKIASHMAKMVKEFWTNIEKVVQFKQQTRLEEKKKKALDLHLNFIVDQTEKYSTWLTEGLQSGSISGSLSTSPIHSSDGGEFEPKDNTSDDEETIEKEEIESGMDESETKKELEDLAKDGELPLEDLLKLLPEEVLATPAPLPDSAAESSSENEEKSSIKEESDEEFAGDEEDASDLEDTIAEQEIHEKRNYKAELDDLQAEGEMSLEELAAKYAGAYDSDFELPENDSSSEEEEGSASDSDDFEIETESSSEEETNLDEDDKGKVHSNLDDLGLQALIRPTCRHDNPVASTPQSLRSKTEEEEEFNDIAAQALSLQPKGNTLETTEVKTKVPFLLKHSLREYQHVGLDWLATMHEKRLNGILADEMGLGKTIQTIALLAHLACEKGIWGPHLIVVPTSVMLNWEMELKKWCPSFKILTYYGNQKERKLKRQGWTKTNAFHVCITSYKLVVQDHQAFRRKKWKYLILDEAQNIKNFKSQRWQMLLNFQSQRRLLLTGTPLQNSLMELWSLMHFLMPNVFQSHRDFKEWFSNPLTGMIEGSQEYNESLIKRLHKVLRPFLLRRLKNEVEKQMPKKYEHVVMCHLSKRQRFLYDDFMSQTKTKETLATGHYMSVINILMQLRKVCNHPNLFDPRPIISPFLMEGLVFHTASIVTHVLEHDPFKHISMRSLFPCLAEMERDLPAFVSHRVKQLKTSNNLIEEIDTQPDPLPRPPPGQLKPVVFHSVSPASVQNSSQASPASQSQAQAGSPVEVLKAALLRSPTPPGLPQSPPALPPKFGVVSHVSTPIVVQSIPQAQPSVSTAVFSPAISGATFTQVRTSTGQTLLLTSQARGGSPALVFSTMGQAPSMSSLALTTSTAPMTSIGSITTNTLPLQATLQAKVLPQQVQSTLHTQSPIPTSMLSSQPITVQIQQTEQGTRLMIPTGQLSQLPAGIIQLVQTSTGQQLFATASALTSTSQQIAPSLSLQTATSTASSTVCNPAPTTTAATSMMVLVTTAASHLKTIPVVSTSASAAAISPPSTTPPISSPQPSKPVMRVSPMVATATAVTTVAALPGSIVTSMVVSTVASGVQSSSTQVSESKTTCISVTRPVEKLTCSGLNKKSELYMATVHERRQQRRIEKLRHLAQINSEHCSQTPVYGPDVRQALSLATDLGVSAPPEKHWHYQGHANCQCAHAEHSKNLPKYYWHETTHLADIIHTPEQYLDELKEILNRFVFAAPTVIAPVMKMRVAHPGPSNTLHEVHLEQDLKQQLLPLSTRLNFIQSRQTIQFPELRLIQYDCGKLQTMDILLRKLKSESHRVLIFTQMTRMLDVLEAFLNYHGHRYLRLDGTTRVEQRQALMERFNADKRIFCFILSTRSGGIGVNLTGADTVIFYDSDWNPTMDAQAQDRCHRIGQTRDVHIYRLISEMTVEENILKKANQKRLLGDLAIEGGNFTTAFFKEQTIKDLFEQPSGLKALAEQKRQKMEADEKEKVESEETEQESEVESGKRPSGGKTEILAMFEQALCKAEDETDAMAATLVKAEQKAELAEFDESIPWDEREAEIRKEEEEMSKAEMELAMLDKELTPIERYAVTFVEMQNEDEVSEELKMAEEDIENSKKDWELARLKALKEEEERRAEMEDDEMLYTYLRDDAQVKRHLTNPNKFKRGPGRPPLNSLRLSSTSNSESESRSPRSSGRMSLLKKEIVEIPKRMRKPANVNGEEVSVEIEESCDIQKETVVNKGRGGKIKFEDSMEMLINKKLATARGRKKTIIKKQLDVVKQNGDLTQVVKKAKGRGRPVTGVEGSVAKPRGKVGRKPLKQTVVSVVDESKKSTPILKIPAVSSPAGILTSPPRNKLLSTTTSLLSSPSNVPPPWSNPNLVIRTRRASVHSPVAVSSGLPVSQNIPSFSQAAGLMQQTFTVQQPSAIVQASSTLIQQPTGIVQLISPTSNLVALAASQARPGTVQLMSGVQVRPSVATTVVSSPLSLAGTRILTAAPTHKLVSAASLAGSVVLLPDGSTRVIGQIGGSSLVGSQPVSNPTVIVSGTGQVGLGARTILAANLPNATARPRTLLTPRLTAQPQVVNATGIRTIQLGSSLTPPLTLRGMGLGVNLVKAGAQGVQIPILGNQALTLRGGQIIQTGLGQGASPQSFVLITPHIRPSVPVVTQVSTSNAPVTQVTQDLNGSTVSLKKGTG